MSDGKSFPASPASSPKSKVSSRTQRQVSCLSSQYASVKSYSRKQQDQSELISQLAEELKEMRIRQNNLKRINDTLLKALQSQPNHEPQVAKLMAEQQFELIQSSWRQELAKEREQNERLRARLLKYQKAEQQRSRISQQSIDSRSSSVQRQQSVRNMQDLMNSIVKERCKVDDSWRNMTTALADKSQLLNSGDRKTIKSLLQSTKLENQQQPSDVTQLVMHLANQKIQMELKIKEIENELTNKDLSKKQRQMLEASLKTMRRNAKSDQYQEYLKDKIIKGIDKYSTQVVMKTHRPR